jgi:transcriptional regulator with XRE-family HTH domain
MNRKTIMQDIALRLKKIRETLGFSTVDMTKRIGSHRANYYKYENARAFPHFTVLSKLGTNLGVSLDWLILNKGPMFYKEKDYNNALAALPTEIQELVTEMEQVPVLKYEILLNFHQYKENRKVNSAESNKSSVEEADHVV